VAQGEGESRTRGPAGTAWARIRAAQKPYGAAEELRPGLRELVTFCKNEEGFPEDRKKKTVAVEDAIEAATDQPKLRSIAPMLPKANRGE
jgi:hypothetical protein